MADFNRTPHNYGFKNRSYRPLAAAVVSCLLTLVIATSACGAGAEPVGGLWLPSLFSDRMVLQQGKPAPVWGKAAPMMPVAVEFQGQKVTGAAGADGRWKVLLAPLSASKVGADLTVTAGMETRAVRHVVVGEVWLLSGQSNMAFLMSSILRTPEITGSERRAEAEKKGKGPSQIRAEKDMAEANDPLLRSYRVDNVSADRPREDARTKSGWMEWNKKNAPDFSAMGYYFAERLRKSLDVPVGIVQCSWGGSGASSWVSAEALRGPDVNTVWPEDVLEWTSNIRQTRLYNGMLKPTAPYAIKGFAWYQGETEAVDSQNAYVHRYVLKALIKDWRRTWRDDELPFYLVQLPALNNGDRWAVVRESQSYASLLPHTWMVPTLDIVPPGDLHPKNKYAVAGRMADMVLTDQYKKGGDARYPRFDRIEPAEGGALRVKFKEGGGNLKTSDGAPPREFHVAGEDRVFKPAEAVIAGTDVVVRSADVPRPLAVRYAFVQAPQVNLTNEWGLPAAPFRSDDWLVPGQEAIAQALPEKASLSETFKPSSLIEGKHGPWKMTDVVSQGEKGTLSANGTKLGIQTKGWPRTAGLPASPQVLIIAEPAIDPKKGLTFEVAMQINEAGSRDRGFDVEAGIRQADGSLRRYLVTVFPTRIETFQNVVGGRVSEGMESRVLRTDLDAQSRLMRLAIRTDGVAQIYDSGALIGTTSGVTEPKSAGKSYLRFGKSLTSGAWSATVFEIAYDLGGAYAPPSAQARPGAGSLSAEE
jgi:sialate O-acetylesterase